MSAAILKDCGRAPALCQARFACDRIIANETALHEGLAKRLCSGERAGEANANASMVLVGLTATVVGSIVIGFVAKYGGKIGIRNIAAAFLDRS
jgi:hypothetical protein